MPETASLIVASFFLFVLILLLTIFQIFKNRRRKLKREGLETTGTILDITSHFGRRGNRYYQTHVEFRANSGNMERIIHFSEKKLTAMEKGDRVELLYNPLKPTQYILKDDRHGRVVSRFFLFSVILIIALGIIVLYLLM